MAYVATGLAALFFFSAFAASVFYFLPSKLSLGAGLSALLRIGVGAYGVWLSYVHAGHWLLSSLLYTIALSLFLCALYHVLHKHQTRLTISYSSDVPELLIQDGPYKYMRNPFYTAYLLGYAAPLFIHFDEVYLALYAVLFVIYLNIIKTEEQKFESSPLASEYARYKRRTGRLFPRLRRGVSYAQT